jgi:hypothetical protein
MSDIIDKLNLTKPAQIALVRCPDTVMPVFASLNTTQELSKHDCIFAFSTNKAEFLATIKDVMDEKRLNEEGILYIAYPKKGNPLYPDYVHRDEIFGLLKVDVADGSIDHTPFRFNRMVAFDEVFTVLGIKYSQKGRSQTAPSQSTGDYIGYIDDVRSSIQSAPEVLTKFDALTPGYQRDWARYLYSTPNEATRKKRVEEMSIVLKAGFKTAALYKQSLKK